jgi:hypothetical protein
MEGIGYYEALSEYPSFNKYFNDCLQQSKSRLNLVMNDIKERTTVLVAMTN